MKKIALVLAVLLLIPVFAGCLAQESGSEWQYEEPTAQLPEGTLALTDTDLTEEQQDEVLRILNEALNGYSSATLPKVADPSSAVVPQLTHTVPTSVYMILEATKSQVYFQKYEEQLPDPLPEDFSASDETPVVPESAASDTVPAAAGASYIFKSEAEVPKGTESTPPEEEGEGEQDNIAEEWPLATTAEIKTANFAAMLLLSDLYVLKVEIAGDLTIPEAPVYQLVDVLFVDGQGTKTHDQISMEYGGIMLGTSVDRAVVSSSFINVVLPGIVPTLHGNFIWDKNDGIFRIWIEEYGYFCYSVVDGKAVGEPLYPVLTNMSAPGMSDGAEQFNYIEVGQIGTNMFDIVYAALKNVQQ